MAKRFFKNGVEKWRLGAAGGPAWHLRQLREAALADASGLQLAGTMKVVSA